MSPGVTNLPPTCSVEPCRSWFLPLLGCCQLLSLLGISVPLVVLGEPFSSPGHRETKLSPS